MTDTQQTSQLVYETIQHIAALWPTPPNPSDRWPAYVEREARERYGPKAHALFVLYPEVPPELAARALFYGQSPHEVLAQIEHERTAHAQHVHAMRAQETWIAEQAMHERDDALNVLGVSQVRAGLPPKPDVGADELAAKRRVRLRAKNSYGRRNR